ncbi:MAG: L,D-transpeptidase family protein [Firmicutes bacterium]|nr:L,D-transpeptidase family protein [Bacillota bacterium]
MAGQRQVKKRQAVKRGNSPKPLLILIVLLASLYLAGFVYAGGRFLPRTYINGVKVSGLSAEDANTALIGDGPKVTILEREKDSQAQLTETISLMEGGGAAMAYDTEPLLDEQNRALWFLCFLHKTEINSVGAEGEFDEYALDRAIKGLYAMQDENNIEPLDATLSEEAGRVEIVPERDGSLLDREEATRQIRAAVDRALAGEGDQTVDLEPLYAKPQVRAGDPGLLQSKEEVGRIIARTISIEVTASSVERLAGAEIMDLISLDGYEYYADREKIDVYVDDLASRYNVSRYEYVVEETLADQLQECLLGNEDNYLVADWYINYPQPGSHGNGSPSFIEVSIGKQHMWYYEYGEEILSCDVVTGNPNAEKEEYRTPTGYFELVTKLTDTHLIGDDYDVEVKYWMGFEYSGYYGFHDAPWRGAFGGKIFMTDPSHGCVNLPDWVAATLFDMVDGRTEVYIYDRPEDYPEETEEEEEEKSDEEGADGETPADGEDQSGTDSGDADGNGGSDSEEASEGETPAWDEGSSEEIPTEEAEGDSEAASEEASEGSGSADEAAGESDYE